MVSPGDYFLEILQVDYRYLYYFDHAYNKFDNASLISCLSLNSFIFSMPQN